jgi:hypothetical protein
MMHWRNGGHGGVCALHWGCPEEPLQKGARIDIHLLSSNDHFADEALDHRLTLFERELIQIFPQELPKGLRMVHDLLPMHRLLLCLCELLEFLDDLLQFGRHFPPATLSCVQADDLGLIGIE